MKNKRVTLQAKRIFSEEFKRQCVKEYESGQQTVQELGSLYGIKVQTIYRWIYRYSTYNKKKLRIVEMDESSTKKVKELQQRIKELERIVGQKQIQLDFFETMMEVAKDQLGLDIKKNFSTQASKSSGKEADDGTA
jgi:transposase-like protein